jgi:hypothetical protein
VPQHPYGMEQQHQILSFTDSSTKAAESTEDPAERKADHYERLIEIIAAERDSARSRCHQAESVARVQCQRSEQLIWHAHNAAKSARDQADYEFAKLKEKILQDYEEVKSSKDTALKDLSEAKAQLAAIEMRESDSPPCETCPHLADENSRLKTMIRNLELYLCRCERDHAGAQASIIKCNNTIDVNDEKVKGLTAEIAEEKAEVTKQKAENYRLSGRLVAFEEVLKLSRAETRQKENALADLIEQYASRQSLVVRIVVWVGGEDGTDTETALVKMDPDTSFKAVLEDLRRHHPLKALKQKSTGRYIFDSDTPAYVSS